MIEKYWKKYWPVLPWAFFLCSGANGGLQIAASDVQPKDPLPLKLYLILTTICLAFGWLAVFVNKSIKRGQRREEILKKGKFYLLGGSFFSACGVTGLIQCEMITAPIINKQILGTFLFVGLGIFLGCLTTKSEDTP